MTAEAVAPWAAAVTDLGLPVLPMTISVDPAWPALFRGGPPPPAVAALLRALDQPPPEGPRS